ncbi:hypothetical protein AX17_003560 [Amanita inopinata Kibby_2008]|nr:hypothetical protein AX17_003560 [Amanita inopinata Kibby_2008]
MTSQQQQQQQATPFTYPISSDYAQQQQADSPQNQSQNAASNASSSSQLPQSQSRQAAEEARNDRTLAEFLLMLDDYEPLIPNEVTDYFLQRVGFECEDARLKRLLSLAAQKFVSDIAADAYQHARIRTNAAGGRARAQALGGPGFTKDKTRTTLTMDDLSSALAEYGINARKPEFYM